MVPPLSNGGMVYLVGGGPGDPGLITVRAVCCLEQADVVIYDRLVNPSLLAYARHAELIDAGKEPDHHAVPQTEINRLLIEQAGAGKKVVRLKGGDPFVFGRGGEEAAALAEAGIPFVLVPGVTSAIAAPAYAGIPVTHRDLACSVAFATGHRAGPTTDPACDWQRLAEGPDTLVFLMGVHNLPRIAAELIAHGRAPSTPAAVIARATTAEQETVCGTLEDIAARARGISPPAVIVVGEVVHLRETLRWFDTPARRGLFGRRILNMLSSSQAGALSRRLAALGAAVLDQPGTEAALPAGTDALDAALRRLAAAGRAEPAYRRIIFPTAAAAACFMARLFVLGYDARLLAGCRLHALPPAAAALRAHGLAADEVGPVVDAAGGERILLPQAHATAAPPANARSAPPSGARPIAPWDGPEGLAEALRCRGAFVDEVTVYTLRTAAVQPAVLAMLRTAGVLHALVAGEPGDFLALADWLPGEDLPALLAPLPVICAGEAAARQARAMGLRVAAVVGEPPDDDAGADGLLHAIIACLT